MAKRVIQVGIEKELLKELDNYIEQIGMGANRSGFVNEAVKNYLTSKRI